MALRQEMALLPNHGRFNVEPDCTQFDSGTRYPAAVPRGHLADSLWARLSALLEPLEVDRRHLGIPPHLWTELRLEWRRRSCFPLRLPAPAWTWNLARRATRANLLCRKQRGQGASR